jgi:hypothetical protein
MKMTIRFARHCSSRTTNNRLNKEIMDKELARQMMEAERRSRQADQPFAPEEPPYVRLIVPLLVLVGFLTLRSVCCMITVRLC